MNVLSTGSSSVSKKLRSCIDSSIHNIYWKVEDMGVAPLVFWVTGYYLNQNHHHAPALYPGSQGLLILVFQDLAEYKYYHAATI